MWWYLNTWLHEVQICMCLVTLHPIEGFNSFLIYLIPLAACTLCGYEFRSGHECWFQVSLISHVSGGLSLGWFSFRSVQQRIILLELDLNGAGTVQWGWSLQQQNKKTMEKGGGGSVVVVFVASQSEAPNLRYNFSLSLNSTGLSVQVQWFRWTLTSMLDTVWYKSWSKLCLFVLSSSQRGCTRLEHLWIFPVSNESSYTWLAWFTRWLCRRPSHKGKTDNAKVTWFVLRKARD